MSLCGTYNKSFLCALIDKKDICAYETNIQTVNRTNNPTSMQITKHSDNHTNRKAEETIKIFGLNFPAGNFQLQFLNFKASRVHLFRILT